MTKILTPSTVDSKGITAHQIADMIGVVLTHTGNGKQYVITGYCWMGATDGWGFSHREALTDGVPLCRPFSQIFGTLLNGQPRYVWPDK